MVCSTNSRLEKERGGGGGGGGGGRERKKQIAIVSEKWERGRNEE